jgi:hypothetical protein
MREFDPQKTEMNAIDFGIVLHKTVENFANEETIRESRDSAAIEGFVLMELDAVLSDRFGTRLSLPVRVQRESLRARLRQFARIQAEERRAGWRIQSGEKKKKKERTLSSQACPLWPASIVWIFTNRPRKGVSSTTRPLPNDGQQPGLISSPLPESTTFSRRRTKGGSFDGGTCNFRSTARWHSCNGPMNPDLP